MKGGTMLSGGIPTLNISMKVVIQSGQRCLAES